MTLWDARSTPGRLLRLPLRYIPPAAVVPVISGPLRGMRWIVGSAPHGAWLGTLERRTLRHFTQRLRGGMTVWDIGANVGLYTLASARAVGTEGRVYAFEPMQRNLDFLRRHLALNGLENVETCASAVTDVSGVLRMADGASPSEFHADPRGAWEVPTVTVDEWRAERNPRPPDVVKIDVEGSDDAVLRGGAHTFATYRPAIYLSLHGERQHRECRRLLLDWRYRLVSMRRDVALEASDEWLAEAD